MRLDEGSEYGVLRRGKWVKGKYVGERRHPAPRHQNLRQIGFVTEDYSLWVASYTPVYPWGEVELMIAAAAYLGIPAAPKPLLLGGWRAEGAMPPDKLLATAQRLRGDGVI